MTEVLEKQDLYREDFQRVLERSADRWGWLRRMRGRAFERFASLGFPTTRDEQWRFTSVKPIAHTPFTLPEPDAADAAPDVGRRFALRGVEGPVLVFVDGLWRADLSVVRGLPDGARVLGLAEAAAGAPELLRAHLGRHASFEDDAFTALNTAFIEDGALVHIGRGVRLGSPIHLLYISTASQRPRVTHPRNLIVAEAGGEATVIEHYVAMGDAVCLSNAVTEAVVGDGARLRHYLIEEESERAFNITTLRAHQERDSRFESHTALFGGSIVRNNVHVELHGAGCDSLVNGLFMPRGAQHMDNHMRVVHAAPHCESRQFYNGVLDERARGVFGGRIYVAQAAQKTDAKQTNRNLLLSDAAQINTKPQLEIYADDVKCTHGATTGRLDEAALFYLRSRGVSRADARGLLIYAFARESLDRMDDEAIRGAMERRLIDRLPQTRHIAPLCSETTRRAGRKGRAP